MATAMCRASSAGHSQRVRGRHREAANRYRLAPADDPGERAADRTAEDMVLRGRAQPLTMTPHIPLIQRRAFIGPDPISAKRAEFGNSPHEEFGDSRPEKKVRKKAR